MDVIKSQASAQVAINYSGTLISMLALVLVYPLDENEGYGLAQYISMTAMFLSPFVTLGMVSTVVKFFPEFEENGTQKGYMTNIVMLTLAAMTVVFALIYFFSEPLLAALGRLSFDIDLLRRYAKPLALTTIFVVMSSLFSIHAANYNRIAVPALFNNLLPKIAMPILILLLYFEFIDYEILVWCWTATFGVIALGLFIHLKVINAFDFAWLPKTLSSSFLKRIASYASFNGLMYMGTGLANRMDVIMVTLLLGEKVNGVYVTVLFIGGVVAIPTQAVLQIVAPQISKAWNRNDLAEIKKLYHRSSSNLFIAGVVVYLLCLGNIDAVFSLTANYEGLSTGITAFAFLGGARLVDMLTSANAHIIMFSKDYKINTLFVVILGVVNMVLNYHLINLYGLTGAAVGTFVSIVLFNAMKSGFIYIRYGMLPFSREIGRVFVFAFMMTGCFFVAPRFENPFVHMLVFTLVLMSAAVFLIHVLKVNTDFMPFLRNRAIRLLSRRK